MSESLAPHCCTIGIEGMDLMMEKEMPNQNRGFGFVEFYNHAAAEAARRKLSKPEFRCAFSCRSSGSAFRTGGSKHIT